MSKTIEYILKTLVAIALVIFGFWCIGLDQTLEKVLGLISLLTGLIIGYRLYGTNWDWWQWWR